MNLKQILGGIQKWCENGELVWDTMEEWDIFYCQTE